MKRKDYMKIARAALAGVVNNEDTTRLKVAMAAGNDPQGYMMNNPALTERLLKAMIDATRRADDMEEADLPNAEERMNARKAEKMQPLERTAAQVVDDTAEQLEDIRNLATMGDTRRALALINELAGALREWQRFRAGQPTTTEREIAQSQEVAPPMFEGRAAGTVTMAIEEYNDSPWG